MNYGPPPAPDPPRARNGKLEPTEGWSYGDQPPAEQPKSRRRFVLILVAVVALLVVGGGGGAGWLLTSRGDKFTVGTCVRQEGTAATVVDCSASDAYRITAIVDTDAGCPDADQPSLVLTSVGSPRRYACLTPVSG